MTLQKKERYNVGGVEEIFTRYSYTKGKNFFCIKMLSRYLIQVVGLAAKCPDL